MKYIYPTGLRYLGTLLFSVLIAHNYYLRLVLMAIFLFILWFFRNPTRFTQTTNINIDESIISPADGKIIKIEKNVLPPQHYRHLSLAWQQVSIFMRVTDVHVNRMPITGQIIAKHHDKGTFKYAAANQADTDNERLSILIQGNKLTIICQQVAGMLARRIICNPNIDDILTLGQSYGIIQLGSRVDLFLPNDLKINVQVGDRVYAGLTWIVKQQTR